MARHRLPGGRRAGSGITDHDGAAVGHIGRPHRSAGSRQDIADGGGYGGRVLVDGAVPGFHEPELRVRQGAGELAALFWWPGTVVAAVHDDRGLRDAGQLTGQVEARLAGDCRRVATACLVWEEFTVIDRVKFGESIICNPLPYATRAACRLEAGRCVPFVQLHLLSDE